MAAIDDYLQQIRTAVYGRDVRSAIANGIETCYAYVSSYSGIDVNSLATKTELNNYLTKSEAELLYTTQSMFEGFLTRNEAEELYVTATELEDYITENSANTRYATKSQLNDYLTAEQIEDQYVKKNNNTYVTYSDFSSALDSYATRLYVESNYITGADLSEYENSVASTYLTIANANGTFARLSDFGDFHSFDIIVCGNTSSEVPDCATHIDGAIGSLRPSINTMYKIYLVRRNHGQQLLYDKYITVEVAPDQFRWEKLGNVSSAVNPDSGESGGEVTGDYITYDQLTTELNGYLQINTAASTYATIESLSGYLSKNDAASTYMTNDSGRNLLTALVNEQGFVTSSVLMDYITETVANSRYAKKTDLNDYTNTEDLGNFYATKEYVSNYVITFPTGDNVLQNLEFDEIPGTRQVVDYDANGNIIQIRHVKDGRNFRVDAFTFTDSTIKEERTLESGQKLIITTYLETSITETSFIASSS